MPEILVTEADRRVLERTAWDHVKHLNAPRKVRLMLRDQFVAGSLQRMRAGGVGVTPSNTTT